MKLQEGHPLVLCQTIFCVFNTWEILFWSEWAFMKRKFALILYYWVLMKIFNIFSLFRNSEPFYYCRSQNYYDITILPKILSFLATEINSDIFSLGNDTEKDNCSINHKFSDCSDGCFWLHSPHLLHFHFFLQVNRSVVSKCFFCKECEILLLVSTMYWNDGDNLKKEDFSLIFCPLTYW